ncbi:hypothetical protein PUN28_001007 [Cardiocondyla obscurior]|uniref:Uncharacterized protein n=1 Tax=Cardiocondyla obscurior TaxID=286306 RepID=A0AAW2H2E5_9HYME
MSFSLCQISFTRVTSITIHNKRHMPRYFTAIDTHVVFLRIQVDVIFLQFLCRVSINLSEQLCGSKRCAETNDTSNSTANLKLNRETVSSVPRSMVVVVSPIGSRMM